MFLSDLSITFILEKAHVIFGTIFSSNFTPVTVNDTFSVDVYPPKEPSPHEYAKSKYPSHSTTSPSFDTNLPNSEEFSKRYSGLSALYLLIIRSISILFLFLEKV